VGALILLVPPLAGLRPVFAQDDQANAEINAAAGHGVELSPSWEELDPFAILDEPLYPFNAELELDAFEILYEQLYPFDASVNNAAVGHVDLPPS